MIKSDKNNRALIGHTALLKPTKLKPSTKLESNILSQLRNFRPVKHAKNNAPLVPKDAIPPILFSDNQKQQIESLVHGLDEKQTIWLSGYLAGLGLSKSGNLPLVSSLGNGSVKLNGHDLQSELTVLYGSRTGNGAAVAKKINAEAIAKGFSLKLQDMNEYPLHKLKDEKFILVIVSTHGEGVPPIAAEEFYEFLHGKRAPKLGDLKFSVLALGDSGYLHFCKTGKDIDERLEALGAERIFPRIDCDIDFVAKSSEWIQGVLDKYVAIAELKPQIKLTSHAQIEPAQIYNRQNPFEARLLEKIKLSGRGSDKETYQVELSLENSGITYEPGDALGVFSVNPQKLVAELIEILSFNPDEEIETDLPKTTIQNALTRHYEISLLTADVLKNYNRYAQSKDLHKLLSDIEKLKDYMFGRDIIDLIRDYPVKLSPAELLGCLKKLQPRLYSIASSLKAYPDEVHLTVTALHYTNGRRKNGICSTFLTDYINDEDTVLVYPERNPEFRLPVNPDTPIIMVGPGTGVAPFRSFLQEREALGHKGKNWLFLGDRHFTTNFLYQTELQAFHKKGLLTRLNVAFSRDTEQKVYVQHKMQEHSRELFTWLEEGANFYVCGDMKHMWHDVNKTLLEIIGKEGGFNAEQSEAYLRDLKKKKRYLVDVY
jgi:sulfite reductase (NADPH) flavoprotein alpha-component